MADIIVTARPNAVFPSNFFNPTLPSALQAQQPLIYVIGLNNIHREEDVVSDEIVVVGQRLKIQMNAMGFNLVRKAGIPVPLPCIGSVDGNELASLFTNLRFNITNRDFGVGRAGENNIGASGSSMPVDINSNSLKGYDALPGGLNYLVAHEIAHGLKAMQEFNNQMWTQYINGAGSGLSADQQKAQYPNSAEFKANEARANTVGRGILQAINSVPSGFEPTNGYMTC